MADITLLHWNIQNCSNNKLDNTNGAALINYIAKLVALTDANIISILEVKSSAVHKFVERLIPAIDIAKLGHKPKKTDWVPVGMPSLKNAEAYLVIYQKGHKFEPLMPAAGGKDPVSGLTAEFLKAGSPFGHLIFNSAKTRWGGRKPYYVTFKTDTKKHFSIVSYHTMFGRFSAQGVRSVGETAQSRAVLDSGITINMDGSFTSGDFNVDFNDDRGEYANLLSFSKQSTDERTSLVSFTPPGGYLDSRQYRSSAYDNIFKYRRSAPAPIAGGGTVTDLIKDSTKPSTGTGVLLNQIRAFKRTDIKNGIKIQKIPPEVFEDAWHIVQAAISDHLPVAVSMTV